MIKSIITFQFPGSVKLLREAKNVSKQDVQLKVADAIANPPKSITHNVYSYLHERIKDHDVQVEELSCIQTLNVSESLYADIISGAARPCFSTCRENKLLQKNAKTQRIEFSVAKWKRLSEYERLYIFYSDIASDLKAESYKISFVG